MLRLTQLLSAVILMGGAIQAADTKVLFGTGDSNASPFPTDTLTVADSAQKTGLRINLRCRTAPPSPALVRGPADQ